MTQSGTLACAASLAAACVAHGELIYSRWSGSGINETLIAIVHEPGEATSRDELPGGLEFEAQAAQRLTFAGSSRHVTQLELKLAGGNGASGIATMGIIARLYDGSGATPGAELWSGSLTAQVSRSIAPGTVVTFAPNVTVPDRVYLAFEVTSVANQQNAYLGLACGNSPPTIGQSDPNFVAEMTGTGEWEPYQPFPTMYFLARVNAIPAPWSGAAFGVLLLARRRTRG